MPTITDRVKDILDFFKNNPKELPYFGVYDSRNTAGDPLDTIYNKNGVTIDFCYPYGYVEILGLTPEEFVTVCVGIDDIIYDLDKESADEDDEFNPDFWSNPVL